MMRIFKDRKGNFGITTALLMAPLAGAAGMAVDYTQAIAVRTKLHQAADAAALAALSTHSPGVIAASQMLSDGTVTLSQQDARRLFVANSDVFEGVSVLEPEITVTKKGTELTSEVRFEATVPTSLMRALGKESISISGVSTAVYAISAEVDFFMLLDNTPSMGVGATPDDIAKLVAATSDKCAFACHIVSKDGVEDPNSYYNLAKKLGVTTRINVVAKATEALIKEAAATQNYSGQYKFAAYTFGRTAMDTKLQEVQSLTPDLTLAAKNTQMIDLMSIPYQGYNNDQQTAFDEVLKDMTQAIKASGVYDKDNTRGTFMFFVTDGVADHEKQTTCKKKKSGTRCMEPIDIKYCDDMKAQGVTIAALYTTYLPLPTNNFYNTWIKPFQTEINPAVKNCASPGYFFEVSPSQGIEEAMKALFRKAISTPRLTS